MSEIKSRPYNPDKCCEACCFGRGGHASWCEKNRPMVTAVGSTLLVPKQHGMSMKSIVHPIWPEIYRDLR